MNKFAIIILYWFLCNEW